MLDNVIIMHKNNLLLPYIQGVLEKNVPILLELFLENGDISTGTPYISTHTDWVYFILGCDS